MTLVSWPSRTGPLAVSVNAIVPLYRQQFTPYLIGGVGAYGVGAVGREASVNGGAGIEYRGKGVSYFIEMRKHLVTRTLASFGMTFRR